MNALSENISSSSSGGFFSYMSTFDSKVKNDLLNMLQYTFLIIIPIVLLDKGISDLFDSDFDEKTNIELLLEVFGEVSLLIIGMYYVHKLVTYLPTYSTSEYEPVNFISILFIFVVVVFTFQTTLRLKVDMLLERVYGYVFGIAGFENKGKMNNNNNNNKMITNTSQSQPNPQHTSMNISQPMNSSNNNSNTNNNNNMNNTMNPTSTPTPNMEQFSMMGMGSEPVAANEFVSSF